KALGDLSTAAARVAWPTLTFAETRRSPDMKAVKQDPGVARTTREKSKRAAKAGSGKTALVTGASSGIGEALAHRIAAEGFDLVLVARSADKLQSLADTLQADHGVRVRVRPADLVQPGAAGALAAALKRARCAVDLLVNNAGVLEHGDFT